jgi:hypothetical protein
VDRWGNHGVAHTGKQLANEGINAEYHTIGYLSSNPIAQHRDISDRTTSLTDVILAMPLAPLGQIQGEALHLHAMGNIALAGFGQIPWIDRQGAQQA